MRQLKQRLRREVLDGLARNIKRDKSYNLDRLMCRNAKRAIWIDVSGRVAVRGLHNPNHHYQRHAHKSHRSNPGGARTQF